jgi:hypothetical protein
MSLPDIQHIQLFAVLGIGALALLAAVLAAVALSRLRDVRQRLAEVEANLALSDEHYQGLSAGALGQGRRLLQMEQDFARLRSRMDEVAASGGSGSTAFDQAIRMARNGHSAQEIMETCGLGEIEADLVVLMHKTGRID